ncbi:MAG: RluA family pseudouridine synthase [Acidobacteria bacterium]|nr:RluA family pseudouridine synthase [Acidobacteriota bacterium]
MTDRELQAGPDDVGTRIDRFIAGRLDELSRAQVQRLIDEGAVRIGDQPVSKASLTVEEGHCIVITVARRPATTALQAEAIPLDVIYEDEAIAIINKPAGMVMHPAPGHPTGTLVHALLHRFGDRLTAIADASRPGIVHRLDRGTSGVVAVALTDHAHRELARQFAERLVRKEYLALVYGAPEDPTGTVDVPLGRDPKDRKRISTRARNAREAITDWRCIERMPGFGLIEARPRTGRTHQIRVHLAHLRHPIVGDTDYAGRQWRGITEGRIRSAVANFPRPALHARRLAFEHPVTGESVTFEVPLADDILELLGTLRDWRDTG